MVFSYLGRGENWKVEQNFFCHELHGYGSYWLLSVDSMEQVGNDVRHRLEMPMPFAIRRGEEVCQVSVGVVGYLPLEVNCYGFPRSKAMMLKIRINEGLKLYWN